MASASVVPPPGWTSVDSGPGRPQARGEVFSVPGSPDAASHRPGHSPGRLPVGAERGRPGSAHALIDEIETQKRGAVEFQLIERMMHPAEADAPIATVPVDTRPVDTAVAESPAVPTGDSVEASLPVEWRAVAVDAGAVATADGAVAVGEFTYSRVDMSVRLELRSVAPVPAPPPKQDPLVLDLDGDGLETSGVADGVRFDLDADGRADRASVAVGGDALLALDRNGNGRIDDGRELFGDQNGAAGGFAELAAFDENRDGRIDAQDTVYTRLRLLSFGAGGAQLLTGLADAGVRAISLDYRLAPAELANGDSVREVGGFERVDGSVGTAADLLLGFSTFA